MLVNLDKVEKDFMSTDTIMDSFNPPSPQQTSSMYRLTYRPPYPMVPPIFPNFETIAYQIATIKNSQDYLNYRLEHHFAETNQGILHYFNRFYDGQISLENQIVNTETNIKNAVVGNSVENYAKPDNTSQFEQSIIKDLDEYQEQLSNKIYEIRDHVNRKVEQHTSAFTEELKTVDTKVETRIAGIETFLNRISNLNNGHANDQADTLLKENENANKQIAELKIEIEKLKHQNNSVREKEQEKINKLQLETNSLVCSLKSHQEIADKAEKQTKELQVAKNQMDASLIEKDKQINELLIENQNLTSSLSKMSEKVAEKTQKSSVMQATKKQIEAFSSEKGKVLDGTQIENKKLKTALPDKKEEAVEKTGESIKPQSIIVNSSPSSVISGQEPVTCNICITYAEDLVPKLNPALQSVLQSLQRELQSSVTKDLTTFNLAHYPITEFKNANLADLADIVIVAAKKTTNNLRKDDRQVFVNLEAKFGNGDGKPDRRYLVVLCSAQAKSENILPLDYMDGISKDQLAKRNTPTLFISGLKEIQLVSCDINKAAIMQICEWVLNLMNTKWSP